jgi:tetratricopeptide (TPR) repeat protein
MRRRLLSLVIPLVLTALAGCATPSGTPSAAADAVAARAAQLDLAGRRDAAIALYRQALARNPASFRAQYGMARALDLEDQYEEARQHFRRALALAAGGDRDQTLRMLGMSWTFSGQVDEAATCFQEVFDARLRAGNFSEAADEANELGRLYLESGNLDRALQWYRTGHDTAARQTDRAAWQVDLADMRWAHAQARVAARRGETPEVRAFEARVRELLDKGGNTDQQVQYPYLLGYDAFYLGDFTTAVTQLRQADQQDPFILLLLGQAQKRLGQTDAARASFRRVLASTSHAINNAIARPIAQLELGKDAGA